MIAKSRQQGVVCRPTIMCYYFTLTFIQTSIHMYITSNIKLKNNKRYCRNNQTIVSIFIYRIN